MITNDARCTREIKARIVIVKAASNTKKNLIVSKKDLNLRKKLAKCYVWSTDFLCGTETGALGIVDQKYLGTFEMRCWRSTEKICWSDRVRDEEVLQRVKEDRNMLQTIKRKKVNWIGHILPRNCLLKHVIEGKREGKI
jgi:hypothetical protein